jgi:peptide/nickel transport system permease protein
MASAAVIVVLIVVALAAPLIARLVGHDPATQYPGHRALPGRPPGRAEPTLPVRHGQPGPGRLHAGALRHRISLLTLALVSAATYSRLTRGSLLEVLGEDYIRTARSKGLTERRVIYRHALRSALTPVLTHLGIDVGALLGGAIITENVFGLPGLGQLAVQSVTTQDLPVIVGIVLLASFFVVAANIGVDLLYAVLDRRVRL